MNIVKEFREFINKGNVLDLAVAVIIGTAFSKIVTAVNEGIFMPIIGALLPAGDWKAWTVSSLNLQIGRVLGASLDFLITAAIVFLITVKLMSMMRRKRDEAPAAPPPPPADVVLLTEIRDLLKQQR
jgi:large conductance mechanosensitive channel